MRLCLQYVKLFAAASSFRVLRFGDAKGLLLLRLYNIVFGDPLHTYLCMLLTRRIETGRPNEYCSVDELPRKLFGSPTLLSVYNIRTRPFTPFYFYRNPEF